MTVGLEDQNCAQMKFVRNRYNYAYCHNPFAHVIAVIYKKKSVTANAPSVGYGQARAKIERND